MKSRVYYQPRSALW